jgi:hypothetical protein
MFPGEAIAQVGMPECRTRIVTSGAPLAATMTWTWRRPAWRTACLAPTWIEARAAPSCGNVIQGHAPPSLTLEKGRG